MATNILKELEEKFELLKKSAEHLPVSEQLEKASAIRDAFVSNDTINKACETDRAVAERRKKVLDEVVKFRDEVINTSINQECFLYEEPGYAIVKNLNQSIKELLDLICEEQQQIENISNKKRMSEILEGEAMFGTHKKSLEESYNNCCTNRYKILLLGEFQTGKTTFFDTICGGRHIGAIGVGNATSAVPVSVSYGNEDKVDVIWKKKEDFKMILSSLSDYFEDFESEEFDLDNSVHRDNWFNRIEQLRKSQDCPSDLRVLALCAIVLKYYATEKLDTIRREEITINDVHRITKFPSSTFEIDWKKNGVNFSFEDVVFIFIEQVDCFCTSEILKQVNATFIDCPGLFNDDYDTMVTEKAMSDAHAILYLLPYFKATGQDIFKSLKKIKNDYKDVIRKLFIVNNLNYTAENEWFETNKDTIDVLFEGKKTLESFDAHMAYLGTIWSAHKNHLLSGNDINWFKKDIVSTRRKDDKVIEIRKHFESFEDAWDYHYRNYKNDDFYSSLPVNEIVEASGFYSIVHKLITFIKENKAYSILISQGINKFADELAILKRNLKVHYVEPYTKDKEELETIWNNRLKAVKMFSQEIEPIIDEHLFWGCDENPSLEKLISMEIYNKLFTDGFFDDMISSIACMVYDNRNKIFQYKKSELEKYLQSEVNEIMINKFKNRISYWSSLLTKGNDETFNKYFTPRMDVLKGKLSEKWRDLYSLDPDMNSRDSMMTYLTFSDKIEEYQGSQSHGSIDFSSTIGGFMEAFLVSIVAEVSVVVLSVVSVISGIIGSAVAASVIPGIGQALALIVGILLTAGIAIKVLKEGKGAIKREFVKFLSSKIKKEIEEKNLKSKIKIKVDEIISKLLTNCKEMINVKISQMESDKVNALAKPKEEKEVDCINSIEIIGGINSQLATYQYYKSKNVDYAKD